jgi:hypothetical protein
MTSLKKLFAHISWNSLEAMVALRISLSFNKQRSPISSPAMRHLLIFMNPMPNVNASIVHDGVLLEDGVRTVTS